MESSLHNLFHMPWGQDSVLDDQYKYISHTVCLHLTYNNRPVREEILSFEPECKHNPRSVSEHTELPDSETMWSFMITQQLRPIPPKQQQLVLDFERFVVAQTCLLPEENQCHPAACPLDWTVSEPA